MSRRRLASLLAYAGGLCLVAAGTRGSARLYQTLLGYAAEGLPEAGGVLRVLALALGLLAGLGGLTVILGGSLIARASPRVGAFLVELGAGAGLLGLAYDVALLVASDADVVPVLGAFLTSLGGLGIVLSVAAATTANPLPVRRWWRRLRR